MGATVSKTGKSPKSVLKQIKQQILIAPMQPDSNVTLYNPTTKECKLYKVELKGRNEAIRVKFTEINVETPINSATACAIAVTRNYSKPPNKVSTLANYNILFLGDFECGININGERLEQPTRRKQGLKTTKKRCVVCGEEKNGLA